MFTATKGVHDTRDDQKTAMLGKLGGKMEMMDDRQNHFA